MAKIASTYGIFEEFQGVTKDLYVGLAIDESVHYSRYELAADATDESIGFGPITTASVLVISSDYAITYKLNGSSDAVALNANGIHVLMDTAITSLSVSEGNSQACVLEIYLGGT
jgi:hypothetical protein